MNVTAERLPHIDEHAAEIGASPEIVWEALLRVLEGSFGSAATGRVAHLLGCADIASSGPRPLAADSAFPGFHVEAAEQPSELALAGSHRFSDYALISKSAAAAAPASALRRGRPSRASREASTAPWSSAPAATFSSLAACSAPSGNVPNKKLEQMSGTEWKTPQRAEDWSSFREALPHAPDAETMLVEHLIHDKVGRILDSAAVTVMIAVLRESWPGADCSPKSSSCSGRTTWWIEGDDTGRG